jgi:hypothetical protein
MIQDACYSRGFRFWPPTNGSSYVPRKASILHSEVDPLIATIPIRLSLPNSYIPFPQMPFKKTPPVWLGKTCY